MSYYGGAERRFALGGKFTPMLTRLLIINAAVFVLQLLVDGTDLRGPIAGIFGLRPNWVFRGWIWQVFTYMFLHGGVLHLAWNMFLFWMFSGDLENDWGSRKFLKYYLICGLGGGILTLAFPMTWGVSTIGASAAVIGMLVAYGVSYPERWITLLIFFVIPVRVKAKHLALGFFLVEFLHCLSGTRDGIGHFAHVGGAVAGFILLKYIWGIPYYAPRSYDRPQGWLTPMILFQRLRSHLWRSRKEREEEELDRILAKISAQGMESLSRREIRILKERAMGDHRDDQMRH